MPPGRDAAPVRPPSERSLQVLKRAGLKLSFFIAAAAIQAAAGHGFVRPLATLVILSAIAAAVFGLWLRDRPTGPDYNHFDEAAWFLLLGYVLRRLV